jgi:farnesyl diphosphate synthase
MIHPADFDSSLIACARSVEGRLTHVLGICQAPERLMAAMRHGVLGGGKRFRPFLLLETVRCLTGNVTDAALDVAVALECVHSYSLVHDDLPCMDDDDLRRGQPTVHRAFDEATAILAGDALLTLAFEVLAGTPAEPDVVVKLCRLLAGAAGASGMVGGQILDLAAEGRFGDGVPMGLTADDILDLQRRKTGALIEAAVDMGACVGNASQEQAAALHAYGVAIGAAFQIADDLLDVEGDAAALGKATAKDEAKGKATLVTLWGVERARNHLDQCVGRAHQALQGFGNEAQLLRVAAEFTSKRTV